MAHQFFLKVGEHGFLKTGEHGFLVISERVGVAHRGAGGGSVRTRSAIKSFQRVEAVEWRITGDLLVEENLNMIGNLLVSESYEIGGFLRQSQIVEMIGKLSVSESYELNGKLRTIIDKKIVESVDSKLEEKQNVSIYKLLMDLIDDL